MKLNSEKKIKLCQKALYSKQLEYYSELCNIYSRLANELDIDDPTPEQVQDVYSEALSIASTGDTSALSEFIQDTNYTLNEISLLQQYATNSNLITQFKKASEILKQSLIIKLKDETILDLDAINKYKNYMQKTSPKTRSFFESVSDSSQKMVGYKSYLRTKHSINKINLIDDSHLNANIIDKNLTPEAFGATISGYKTPQHVLENARDFKENEISEYKNEPSFVYELPYTIKRTYKANKTNTRKSIAAIIASLAALGSSAHMYNLYQYNTLSSQSTKYESDLTYDTKNILKTLRHTLESYENVTSLPPIEEIKEIRTNLDDVINLVMADLVKPAFEEANPNCKVTCVETEYDRTRPFPEPQHSCYITYIDENNEEQTATVERFLHAFPIFGNDYIDSSYCNEYDLDHSLHSSISAIYNKDNKKDSLKSFKKLIEEYESVLKDTEQLAGTKMIYKDGKLKTVTPEKNTEKEHDRED